MLNFLKALASWLAGISIGSYLLLFCRVKQDNGILIIRPDAVGDFILFLPALEAYRRLFAGRKLTLVISPINEALAARLNDSGLIDDYLIFKRPAFKVNPVYRFIFLRQIRRRGFRTVLYPVVSREAAGDYMVLASGAKERIGLKGETLNIYSLFGYFNGSFYNNLINLPADIKNEAERNYYLVKKLGGEIEAAKFPLLSEDYQVADKILEDNRLVPNQYVIIVPGAGWIYRSWPRERFAAIVSYLETKGLRCAVCGLESEKVLADEIAAAGASFVNLCGKTSIFVLAALLEKAKLYFGSETGSAHLAMAVGCPTVVILGAGHFGRYFPCGDARKNISVYDAHAKCKNDNWDCAQTVASGEPAPCIAAITVEAAIGAIEKILNL